MLLPGRWAGWGPRDPPLSPPKQISTVLHPQQGLAPRPETAWPEGSRCSLGQTVLPAPTLPSSQQLPGLPDPRFLFHEAEEVRIRGATQAERGKGQAGEPARETVPTVTVGSRAALEAKPSLEPRPQEAGKTAAPTRPPLPAAPRVGLQAQQLPQAPIQLGAKCPAGCLALPTAPLPARVPCGAQEAEGQGLMGGALLSTKGAPISDAPSWAPERAPGGVGAGGHREQGGRRGARERLALVGAPGCFPRARPRTGHTAVTSSCCCPSGHNPVSATSPKAAGGQDVPPTPTPHSPASLHSHLQPS